MSATEKDTNKRLLSEMELKFQKDILELWKKEEEYRKLLDEQGITPREALLKLQGYTIPVDYSIKLTLLSLTKDYTRLGRSDIAELLIGLCDPSKHSAIFTKAKEHYSQSPDYNYGFILSICYQYGWGTERNKKVALEIGKRFAAENHPLALCRLAHAYFDDLSTDKDIKKAIEYFERATCAEQQTFYTPHIAWGEMLMEGHQVEKDESRALSLFQTAAEKGDGLAYADIADYYAKIVRTSNTNTSEADIKKFKELVFFYANKANDLNLPGKYLLMECYAFGWGVQKNIIQQLILLTECVDQGMVVCYQQLALYYQHGVQGILERDPIQSLKLYFASFRRLIIWDDVNENDDSLFKKLLSENQQNLLFMEIAFDLCQRCLQGHLLDNHLDSAVVGFFYLNGILLPRNLKKAIECFQKGADLGSDTCAQMLVLLSSKGESEGLLPPSTIAKYIAHAKADSETSEIRKHYQSTFMPLFDSLDKTWPFIESLDKNGMPKGITQLIADYAFTPLCDSSSEEENTEKEKGKVVSV